MKKKAATTFILSLFTALGVALSGVSVADIVTIASGADYYSHPRVNNLDEIVWSQTAEGHSTIWSDKRGQVSFSVYHKRENYPDINDMGEIIWRFGDGGKELMELSRTTGASFTMSRVVLLIPITTAIALIITVR